MSLFKAMLNTRQYKFLWPILFAPLFACDQKMPNTTERLRDYTEQTKFIYYQYVTTEANNHYMASKMHEQQVSSEYLGLQTQFNQIQQHIKKIEKDAIRFAGEQTGRVIELDTIYVPAMSQTDFLSIAGVNSGEYFIPDPNDVTAFTQLHVYVDNLIDSLKDNGFNEEASFLEKYFETQIDEGYVVLWEQYHFYRCPTSLLLYELQFFSQVVYFAEQSWKSRL